MTKRVQAQHSVAIGRREQDEREQATRSASHDLNELVATMPDTVVILDQNFQVRDLNPAACHSLGWSVVEARGKSCTQVLQCRDLNRVELCGTSRCPLLQVIRQEEPLPHEDLILGTRPDHVCEVSTSVTRFQSAKSLPSPIVEYHGSGEKKEKEQETSFVAFVARDVSALKMVNQVRSNFLSMVSHELRTPLNSVHGFIDLLLQGHMGSLNEEQQVYLGYTQKGVQQLVSMVEDVLFMTRSDLGQFQIQQQEVPLRALVRQVVSGLQPQIRKAEVVLQQEIAHGLPTLYIDPQRIIQVLNNLIVNAIKFTPPGKTITIKANRYDADFVLISVIDTGYGIPPEDQPHVFERFYQSNHHQQSKMGGYGLGLSIARLIVEQHSGTIGLESVVNEGTTFSFTMPIFKKGQMGRV